MRRLAAALARALARARRSAETGAEHLLALELRRPPRAAWPLGKAGW